MRGENGLCRLLEGLARRKGTALLMDHEEWFGRYPPRTWKRVGVLGTSKVTSGGDTVGFFVTPDAEGSLVYDLLRRFWGTLPAGAVLRIE